MGHAICFCLYFLHNMTQQLQAARYIVQRGGAAQAHKQSFPRRKSVKRQTRANESHGAHFIGYIYRRHLNIGHITIKPLVKSVAIHRELFI